MRMKVTSVLSVLAALSLSCSGGGLTCESAACGGDPVGAWTVSDNCYDSAGFDLGTSCPGDTFITDITLAGTVTLNADNSYRTSITSSGTVTLNVPAACLQGITDCAQIVPMELVCTGTPQTSCTCVQTVVADPNNPDVETGTWATSGNTITLAAGGTDRVFDYCVQGNSAVFKQAATADTPALSIILSK